MRLIDADVLLKELRERETELCRSGINLVKGGQSIYKIVNAQPNADVEKLVSDAYKEGWSDALDWYGIKAELVKRGGVDD